MAEADALQIQGRGALRGLTVIHNGTTVRSQGPFVHNHVLSRQARRLAEEIHLPLVRNDCGRRPDGPLMVIGGGIREAAALREGDHNCGSIVTPHDAAHARGTHCRDWRCCEAPANIIYAVDFLYYLTARDVGALLTRHGAAAAYFAINAPYVGGCGTRNNGETRWERIDNERVRVTTDSTTLEPWEHSDMVWLFKGGEKIDGRWLTWTPARNDGGRMLYRFAWFDHGEPILPNVKVPTLEDWLLGDGIILEEFDHEPLWYTASQVYSVLGVDAPGADGVVRMPHVMETAAYLAKNPGQRARWMTLAAQKAGGLKHAGHVAATAALAVAVANAQSEGVAQLSGVWVTLERRRLARRLGRALSAGVAFAADHKWELAAGATVLGVSRGAGLSWTGTAAAALIAYGAWRWLSRPRKEKLYSYEPHSVYPTCYPTAAGDYMTPRGGLSLEQSDCEEFRKKPAYVLSGIGVAAAQHVVACSCPATFATAVMRRVLELPPTPATARNEAQECIRSFKRLLLHPGGTRLLSGMRYSFATWVERPSFTTATRKDMRQARAQYDTTQRHTNVSGFVKVELVSKWSDEPGPLTIRPRSIRPVAYTLRCRVGPGVAGIQHALKTVCSGRPVLVVCGRDGRALGEAFDAAERRAAARGDGVGYGLADYGNFDGTNTMSGGQIVGTGVMMALGWPAHEAAIDASATRTMDTSYGARAKWNAGCTCHELDPSVYSGKDCTTCRNTATNAAVHCRVMELVGVPRAPGADVEETYAPDEGMVPFDEPVLLREAAVDDPMVRAAEVAVTQYVEGDGFNYWPTQLAGGAQVMGDDSGVVVPLPLISAYKRHFDEVSKRLGFQPEFQIVTERHDFEICSSLAWPACDEAGNTITVFGPKIGRVLAKFGYKRAHHPPALQRRMMRGDAISLGVGVAHIPILRVLVQRILTLTQNVKEVTDNAMRYKILAAAPHTVSDAVWAFMEGRYGLSREEVLELEGQLWGVEKLPCRLLDKRWSCFLKRDT